MKCEKAQEIFSDRLEGALERPMTVAFDQHLTECPACARNYGAFKTTWQMLETLPEVAPPPGFACDVLVKVRMQREAERRSMSRWQTIWNDLFVSRMPAKVAAAALSLLLLGQVVLRTPLRDTIGAWLISAPIVQTKSDAPANPAWGSRQLAEAWLNSGLSFELDSSDVRNGTSIIRLLIKPKDVSNKHVRVYLMDPGQVRFDDAGIKSASLVFSDNVGGKGQPLPFILRYGEDQQAVITSVVDWEHRGNRFLEAVFVPTQMSMVGNGLISSIHIKDADIYKALQDVSAAFGVVILANADIKAKVSDVNIERGTADDALYKICMGAGLRWRPLGPQVYIVERKIE